MEELNRREKYVSRLVEEWKTHGKVIIAVDFDDTISIYRNGFNKPDIERTIQLLKDAFLTGAYIVVFTACNPDRYEDIQRHCEEQRIPIQAINNNPIELPFGNHKKVYANIFLDDRAGLTEALDILEEAMYKFRGWQEGNKLMNLNDVA